MKWHLMFISKIFCGKAGSDLLYCLKIVKEFSGKNPKDSISGYSQYHSGYSGSKSGSKYNNKDFKRMSFNTIGKDNRLK